jgi:hypothetical protein
MASPSFPRPPKRRMTCLLLLFGLLSLSSVSAVLLRQHVRPPYPTRLSQVSPPHLTHRACPARGRSKPAGLALELTSAWHIQADVVTVLQRLTQQGWRTISRMSAQIELIPPQPTVVALGVGQLRLYHGAALAYTDDYDTHFVLNTTLVACPP